MPAFDVDGTGYVHLQGTLRGGTGTAFTLPAGARPAARSRFAVRVEDATDTLTIAPTGEVTTDAAASDDVSIDGVTFAAGG